MVNDIVINFDDESVIETFSMMDRVVEKNEGTYHEHLLKITSRSICYKSFMAHKL